MRFTPVRGLAIVIVILLVVGAVVLLTNGTSKYTANAFIPAGNPNILVGAPVLVNGFKKGTVDDLRPAGPGAELKVSLDGDSAPLHAGAVVFVQWSAAVGERLLQINDGPVTNPEIPDGGRIEGNMPKPMELSDTLQALDPATRARLGPLTQNLQKSLAGHEQDVNNTLKTAGPAFVAIGNVFRGLAIDQPALEKLVSDTNGLVARIASRNNDLSGIVSDLGTSTRQTAAVRTQLRQTLQKVPGTLDQAQSTLKKVPGTTDEAVPLLNDLQNATDKLPSVSQHLEPVLKDLRPTIAELKPTLQAASELLNYTPGLLDSGHTTVPKLGNALGALTPTVRDLQPYTPCAVGFLSAFGSVGSRGDQNGPYLRIPVRIGTNSFESLPAVLPGTATPIPRSCDQGPNSDPEGQAPGAPVTGFYPGGSGSANAAMASTGGLN
jgi:phospholipid/cholesterol/gamma-HCH transport system substrate-binding protein